MFGVSRKMRPKVIGKMCSAYPFSGFSEVLTVNCKNMSKGKAGREEKRPLIIWYTDG